MELKHLRPEDLPHLSDLVFRQVVNADLRHRVHPVLSEETRRALREPENMRRWRATLLGILRSADSQRTARDDKVQVLNREGKVRTNPIPRGLVDTFAGMPGSWAFDGELLDGELWLFDLARAGEAVGPSHPYSFRLDVLERFFSTWQPGPFVRLLPTARSIRAKQRLACAK
jgi:hypothetical protein